VAPQRRQVQGFGGLSISHLISLQHFCGLSPLQASIKASILILKGGPHRIAIGYEGDILAIGDPKASVPVEFIGGDIAINGPRVRYGGYTFTPGPLFGIQPRKDVFGCFPVHGPCLAQSLDHLHFRPFLPLSLGARIVVLLALLYIIIIIMSSIILHRNILNLLIMLK
jgi:hypothetical protein